MLDSIHENRLFHANVPVLVVALSSIVPIGLSSNVSDFSIFLAACLFDHHSAMPVAMLRFSKMLSNCHWPQTVRESRSMSMCSQKCQFSVSICCDVSLNFVRRSIDLQWPMKRSMNRFRNIVNWDKKLEMGNRNVWMLLEKVQRIWMMWMWNWENGWEPLVRVSYPELVVLLFLAMVQRMSYRLIHLPDISRTFLSAPNHFETLFTVRRLCACLYSSICDFAMFIPLSLSISRFCNLLFAMNRFFFFLEKFVYVNDSEFYRSKTK